MFCRYCGKELNDKAVVCPNCGILTHGEEGFSKAKAPEQPKAQPQPAAQPVPHEKTNVLAIVGFILCFFVSLAGLICSAIALKQLKTSGESGKGLALAGVIISSISIGIVIILALFYTYILVVFIACAGVFV